MANLRLVLRSLARSPLFTAVATLSLALGIGANTAMFSLMDQFLLRTLPVRDPQQLVYLYHPGPVQGSVNSDESGGPSFSYPMFRDLQQQQTPFTGIAGSHSVTASIAYQNSALHGNARLVSGNYFDVLGVRPTIGRLFSESDDNSIGGNPVAVLSYNYWESRFGLSPAVLNEPLLINGNRMTVVGIAQKGFGSEKLGDVPDIYLPITMDSAAFTDRRNYWVSLTARLKPGVSLQRAADQINVAYRAGLERDERLLRQPKAGFLAQFKAKKIILKPGDHGRGDLQREAGDPVRIVMGMSILVLLIACANVANLQLARSVARTREMAIRLAMGASRWQLIRQLLAESCLLAIAGGALGLLAARWTLHGVIVMLPPSTGMQSFLSEQIDGRLMLFCLAVSILTGVLFGLFPALQASKADVVSTIKDQAGQITSGGSAGMFRKGLVTAQVALSLMLLIGAGLFSQTLVNLSRVQLGIRADHLLTFSVMPQLNRYSDERTTQFHRELTGRLGAIPGVTLVTAALVPAIAGSNSSQVISVEGYAAQNDRSVSNINIVDAGYFRTMGMPMVSGREFTRADDQAAPKVVVVNEAFVRTFLQGQNPLGRHMGRGQAGKLDLEIVGVVKDAHYSDARREIPPVFYWPLEQSTRWGSIYYYVRTATEPQAAGPQIRREVAALDPALPIREMKTMQAQIDENVFSERIMTTLSGGMAGLATILAAIGLYGVLAFNVARRTREIGIRMALGADAFSVRGLVMREMLMILAIGTVVGLAGAAGTMKFTQSLLFGLKPWDVFIYSAASAGLWAVALAAAYLPARRATSVDPMVALRYE